MTSSTLLKPVEDAAKKVSSLWWILVAVGAAWIVIGFVVLRFDRATVDVVSIVFGIMVLLSAGAEVLRGFVTPGAWRTWHLIIAVLLVVAAVFIFVNPGATFVSLAVIAGFYFVFRGTFDIITSFAATAVPGWWLGLLAGIAQVVLGFLASTSFSSGVVVLVTYVSLVAIFRGVAEIAAGFTLRATGSLTGR